MPIIETKLPLLITSCVYVNDQSVKLHNPQERIYHTVESINKWLEIDPDINMCVCDNSNYDFTSILKSKHPHSNIECISFKGEIGKTRDFGKGYGEGEIIRYALSNSSILSKNNNFMKCTGKLWVTNYLELTKKWNNNFQCYGIFKNIFNLKQPKLSYIDTRFYITSKKFYFSIIDECYLSLDGRSIEDVLCNKIINERIKKIMMHKAPNIYGVSGASANYYKNPKYKQYKINANLLFVKSFTKYSEFF